MTEEKQNEMVKRELYPSNASGPGAPAPCRQSAPDKIWQVQRTVSIRLHRCGRQEKKGYAQM